MSALHSLQYIEMNIDRIPFEDYIRPGIVYMKMSGGRLVMIVQVELHIEVAMDAGKLSCVRPMTISDRCTTIGRAHAA